jgi:poly(3-hydroxybutyrate) depolymerase
MKSFLAVLAAAALACTGAAPALAMPTDDGPRVVAQVRHAAPVAPVRDDGTPALVFVLIGCGAAAALGTGGYMGARSVTRRMSPRAS